MKVCTECGALKALGEYAKASTCVDGRRSYCKTCHKARKDRWRAANKDHHNAKCRAWVDVKRVKRQEVVAACNAQRILNGKSAESMRRWRERNLEHARLQVNTRRRYLRTATPPWADKAQIKALYREALRTGLTVDHIIPLRHPRVCGLHVPANLQLLTPGENSSKCNRFDGGRS